MTYRTYEDSAMSGRPIELYHFHDDLDNDWFYCTGGHDVEFLGNIYLSAAIMSSASIIGNEVDAENITIDLWKGAEIATQYIDTPVDGKLEVTTYKQHVDKYVQYYAGVIVNVAFDENAVPRLIVEPGVVNSGRVGHRRRNQRSCDHALYSVGYGCCNVVKALFTRTGVISSISGTTVTSTVFAAEVDDWFRGGVLVVGFAKRLITSHIGSTITISRSIATATPGDVLTATAGCDHLPTTCLTKFNNKLNYGGNEFLTNANVYTGHHVMY